MKRIFVAAVAVAALSSAAMGAQEERNYDLKTTDLGKGLYMIEGVPQGNGGNITAAVTPQGVILVDSQYAQLTPKVKAALAKLGPNSAVRYVIDTHSHGDHSEGNENFANSGAIIVAHENVRKTLSAPPRNGAPAIPPAGLPTITYTDAMTVRLGDKVAEIHHMPPAHTDGDSYIYFPDANVLATGDLFGSFRFPAGGTNLDGIISSTDKLIAVANDTTWVVPGHGPLAKKPDLIAYREMLQAAKDRIGKMVADGKAEAEVIAAKPLADYQDKRGGDDMRTGGFVRFVYRQLKGTPRG